MIFLAAANLQPCASYLLYLLMMAVGWKVVVRINRPPVVHIGNDVLCRRNDGASAKMMCFARRGMVYFFQ